MTARKITEVAVGVVQRDDGAVLLADRPSGKPYAGYWEFPGGKIEHGETVHAALARELHEELGIEIGPSTPWVVFAFDYPHAYVRLQFRRVHAWRGAPQPREGQRLGFFALDEALPAPLLPAAEPAMRWLTLPDRYALSAIETVGRDAFLHQLDHALRDGLRLVQLREPSLDASAVAALLPEVRARTRAHGARLLVSSRHGPACWQQADGVHLTAAALRDCATRPAADWVAASVHDSEELARAAALGCDFAVLGPVQATTSHPGAAVLGWDGFAAIAAATPIPLFALGGLDGADKPRALQAGAHGIAQRSRGWR